MSENSIGNKSTEYPKRNVENPKDVPWTNHDYDYNDLKMDMPIP